MYARYADRCEAGKKLAERLAHYQGKKDAVVLALPRGGVAVACVIAKALGLPLDLMLVRKLGVPGDEEFAMGAIAMGDVCFLNDETVRLVRLPPEAVQAVIARETKELMRRNEVYRGGAPAPDVVGKTVLLVDDGMATGADMRVAARAARQCGAARVVVAVPVSSDTARDALMHEADEVVCLHVPQLFPGVGAFYQDFRQMADDDVLLLLAEAASG